MAEAIWTVKALLGVRAYGRVTGSASAYLHIPASSRSP